MADQHIGYPGTVNSAQLANWMPNVAAAQYSVEGLTDAQVVTNAIGSRGVTVKKGTVIGDGIMDVFENDTNLNLGSVATGSPDRWDMVVLRRTWSATVGASTSIYTVIPGGPNKTLPARNNNKGVLSDQPIALCRVKAGNSNVQEIVDLRCWASNGGVQAVSELVMSYLDGPGSDLLINGQTWARVVAANGTSVAWSRIAQQGSIDLFGVGNSFTGGVNDSKAFLIQAGTWVATSDANGYSRLTFPKPFPNGCLFVAGFDGDDWTGGGSLLIASAGRENVFGKSGIGGKSDWVYATKLQPAADDGVGSLRIARAGGKVHRLNWIAIGW